MRATLVLSLLLGMWLSECLAADLRFTWTPNTDATQGYRLLMDGGTNVVQEIPGRDSAETTYAARDGSPGNQISDDGVGNDMAITACIANPPGGYNQNGTPMATATESCENYYQKR